MQGVVLAGTAVTRPDSVGTLYRLEDGGSWKTVDGIPETVGVQAITPHPSKPGVVYAATRKGVFQSDDSGRSWRELGLAGEGRQFWSVAVSPHDHDVLFVGSSPVGFYRSADGGRTWRPCRCDQPERFKITFGGSRAMSIAFHPTDPRVMYAVAEINGLLVSTDSGDSWQGANTAIERLSREPALRSREVTDDDTEGMFDAHWICTSAARPDAAFYGCRMGIFATDDRGESLTSLDVDRYAPFHYTRGVRPAIDDPRTLYACFSISSRSEAGAMYRSRDVGESWERIDSQVTPKSTILGIGLHASDPRALVSVTRHGQVFYTADGARSWTETRLPANAGDCFCGAVL